MNFDYSKLEGRIKEKYQTQKNFCKKAGISEKTMSDKTNGKSNCGFTQKEIDTFCVLLSISIGDIGIYFFTPKVQSIELRPD